MVVIQRACPSGVARAAAAARGRWRSDAVDVETLGPSGTIHSRSPQATNLLLKKRKKFRGTQTQFIHGTLKDKYLDPEIY